VPSHGGSAVVIFTEPNRTLLLTAGHLFSGEARGRRILLDCPVPAAGAPQEVGVRLLRVDSRADLALIELRAGPLPFVAPVARQALPGAYSVGYDELKLPAVVRPVHELGSRGGWTTTVERPWHGRSGGALLSADGYLVGIVSAYSGPPDHREVERPWGGIYVSQSAILEFLDGGR